MTRRGAYERKNKFVALFPILPWLRRHELLGFFILDLAIEYVITSCIVASLYRVLPLRITDETLKFMVTLVDYAPSLSAILLIAVLGGRNGLRQLFGRLLLWRVGIPWYFFVLFFQAVISSSAITISKLLMVTTPTLSNLDIWYIVFLFPYSFLEGPLQEEFGWRGYVLPRLQMRRSSFSASLILGLIWGLWHLPGRLLGKTDFSVVAFVWFLIWAIALSVLFTWVYNNTKGSLFMALVFHAAINTTVAFTPALHEELGPFNAALAWIAAIVVVKVFGPEHLSRKPLSRIQWLR